MSLRPFVFISVLFGIQLFIGLDSPPWDQDESAYFGFSKNMLETGNYRIPEFPLSEPHRKTPLHFWVGVLAYKLLGYSYSSFRIFNLLFFIAALGVTYYFYREYDSGKNPFAPILSLIVLTTGFFLPLYSKIALTDIPLFFYSMTGIYSLWMVTRVDGNDTPPPSSLSFWDVISEFLKVWKWVLGFWVSVALGVLQKGPPILILLGGICLALLVFSPQRRKLAVLHPWLFLPLSLMPLLIWGKLAWDATNGEFILWLVDWYILRRTTGSVFGQSGPPGYYLVLLLFFFYPWSFYLPGMIHNIFRRSLKVGRTILQRKSLPSLSHRDAFLFGWFFSSYIFYELVPSKLPSYVLASYPIWAMWIAKSVRRKERFLWNRWLFLIPTLLLPAGLIYFAYQSGVISGYYSISIMLTGVFISLLFYIWLWKGLVIGIDFLKGKFLYVLLLFHIFLSAFYLPLIHTNRSYGEKFAEILSGQNVRKIFIHPEIRLPSIPLALSEKQIPLNAIEVSGDLERHANLQEGEYLLASEQYSELLASAFALRKMGCRKFFSYESGRNLSLCWMTK